MTTNLRQSPTELSNYIGNRQFIVKNGHLSNRSDHIRVIGHIELKSMQKRWWVYSFESI